MGNPIYILAGQSNANAMQGEFEAALQAANGSNTYYSETIAAGGAPLTWQRNNEDWRNDTELRDELYNTIYNILDADPDAYLAGIIWVQGEADTYPIARADEYAQSLQELIEDVRNNLAQDFPDHDTNHDEFDLIISGLSENAPEADSRANWETIRDQQTSLSESSDDIQLINPDEIAQANGYSDAAMFKDGLHYSNSFQTTLMNALVDNLLQQDANNTSTTNDNSETDYSLGTGTGDIIYGSANRSQIYGDDGDNTLVGGPAWDVFKGGAGNDTFVFTDEDRRWRERVLDFEDTKDRIVIDTETVISYDDLYIYEHNSLGGTVVNYGSGSFILMGVDTSLISESDFDFI